MHSEGAKSDLNGTRTHNLCHIPIRSSPKPESNALPLGLVEDNQQCSQLEDCGWSAYHEANQF
jgi:hypothetical protein